LKLQTAWVFQLDPFFITQGLSVREFGFINIVPDRFIIYSRSRHKQHCEFYVYRKFSRVNIRATGYGWKMRDLGSCDELATIKQIWLNVCSEKRIDLQVAIDFCKTKSIPLSSRERGETQQNSNFLLNQ
ncbi:hypothetical protein WA026_008889, partial [Henosepilachna vigintioctopunctata]